jgi:hypothetical protein
LDKTVEQPLRAIAVERLKKMLDELSLVSGAKGESVTDFLRVQRMR